MAKRVLPNKLILIRQNIKFKASFRKSFFNVYEFNEKALQHLDSKIRYLIRLEV